MWICAELHRFPGIARAIWNRNGRRMGSRYVAGDGKRAEKEARNSERDAAERIFGGIHPGSDCGAICAACVGLASHVLARRNSGVAGAVHTIERAGIRSVEDAPCSQYAGCLEGGRGAM